MTNHPGNPLQQTLANLLLTLTALSGEFPAAQVGRLPSTDAYRKKVLKQLKAKNLLHTYSRDGLRGLRLTAGGKRLLLEKWPDRFLPHLSGRAETNSLKSEVPRRLRLYRMAEVLTAMYNAGVTVFPWEKPPIFASDVTGPAYYSSRELKGAGPQGAKIQNARATGVLAADGGFFAVYNTAAGQMKWDYRAEMRLKALLQMARPQNCAAVRAMMFGSGMEQMAVWMEADRQRRHNYFVLDGSFEHFYFLTLDRRGDFLLRLLCDRVRRETLDGILSENLLPPDAGFPVEHDGLDGSTPVLFGYTCDLPRIRRFDTALSLREMPGILICFDYQESALRRCCGPLVRLQCIDLAACERSLFHEP